MMTSRLATMLLTSSVFAAGLLTSRIGQSAGVPAPEATAVQDSGKTEKPKIDRESLAGKRFKFYWKSRDGGGLNGIATLRADGSIRGIGSPNESTWLVDDAGRLVFKHADGRRGVLLNNYHFAYTAWPTVEFDVDAAKVVEICPKTGKAVRLLDDSPAMPGVQLSIDSGKGRLFLLPPS